MLHYIWLQLIYTNGMPMGIANYITLYYLIGQCYYTCMYMFVIIYWRGNTILLSLHYCSWWCSYWDKRKITMVFPNVMGESYEEEWESVLKWNCHKVTTDPSLIVYWLKCIFKPECCKDKNHFVYYWSPWMEITEENYSEELQSMFRALQ